jgi:sulfatase maturation enzyme AslB (radical SAM superfamily)
MGIWEILMAGDKFICSKMFTDMNIKFPYDGLKNCCKSTDYIISDDELDALSREGKNVLTHNAEYQRRKHEMVVNNQLPDRGCDTCIRTEPNSLFRSWNIWRDDLPSNEQLLNGDNFTTYEFVLSSACDLKCVYCSEDDSTSWAKELGVPVNKGNTKWKDKILADLITHLKAKQYIAGKDYFFFFSGGEPTYNTETLPLIMEIIDIVPAPTIIISTNINMKLKIMDRYLSAVQDNPNVQWTFDCSIDDIGAHAEAVRYGLDWDRAIANIRRIMEQPNAKVRISPTVNMYSLPQMFAFVKYFHELFIECNRADSSIFNFNMVQEDNLSPWSMPLEYAPILDAAIEYCEVHNLKFATHLRNVQRLIGTKINRTTVTHVEAKWSYFMARRPDTDWPALFPHIEDIITTLKLVKD